MVLTLVQYSATDEASRKATLLLDVRPDGRISLALRLIDVPQTRRRRAVLGELAAAAAASARAPTLCFDLSFGELMNDGERVALARQLALCYGYNRTLSLPFQLSLAGLSDARQSGVSAVLAQWNWEQWSVMREEASGCDVYAGRRDVVYLSSESPDALEAVESGTVYVIGGLVDHTCKEGVTQRLAAGSGVRTARLPLEHFVTVRKPALTCLAVVQIMAGFVHTASWERAVREAPAMNCAPLKKYVRWKPAGGHAR
mgnify:CR=1 FL=1